MANPPKPLEIRRKNGNVSHRPLPELVEVGPAPATIPDAPSHLGPSGRKAWRTLWNAGRVWLGDSDALAVKLAAEQSDEIAKLRAQASRIKAPGMRLQYLYAVQKAETNYLSTLSHLGFTPTARARLGLVVAQAAETESRLSRFTSRRAG